MFDGYEPHGTIDQGVPGRAEVQGVLVGGGVYPGWWDLGWAGRGYTGTHPLTLPGPIFNLFLRLRPTHGQMKGKSEK